MKTNILIAGIVLGTAAVAASPRQSLAQWSIGPHLGYNIDAREANLGGTAHIKLPVKLGIVNLVANPGFEFYPFIGSGASLLVFNLDVVYPIPAAGGVSPYAGAGLGISQASVSGGGFSASSTDAVFNLKGGAIFGKGTPIRPFAEATLAVGSNSTLLLRGGVQFTVGK